MDELEGRQKVEILCSAVVAASAFMPFLRVPIIGGIAPFDLGWPGYVIAGLGLVALLGAGSRVRWVTPVCAAIAILMVAAFLCGYAVVTHDLAHGMDGVPRGNPLRGLGRLVASTVGLGWGWFVLLLAGIGCATGQTLADLFLGSGPPSHAASPKGRHEPHFGPVPPGLRRRETLVIREPRGPRHGTL